MLSAKEQCYRLEHSSIFVLVDVIDRTTNSPYAIRLFNARLGVFCVPFIVLVPSPFIPYPLS